MIELHAQAWSVGRLGSIEYFFPSIYPDSPAKPCLFLLPWQPVSVALEHHNESRLSTQAEFEMFVSELFSSISVESQLSERYVPQFIACCAQEIKVDLIIMPAHGCGPFRQLLFGSVSAKVLHDMACPVWTGVHADKMPRRVGGGWDCFLCAVDTDEREVYLPKWAAQFACEQGAKQRVVPAVPAAACPKMRMPYWNSRGI